MLGLSLISREDSDIDCLRMLINLTSLSRTPSSRFSNLLYQRCRTHHVTRPQTEYLF